ncbi:MAG: uroporphyrinogen decarboxylase family protein [Eggerthellaceae bacterium]
MAIKDFHCTYDNASGINAEAVASANVTFPEVHNDARMMANLSKALKEYENAPFCTLPFCHTVEAEALGGIVNLGDENAGPRCGGYITQSMSDILDLPDIDFTKGRIAKVLEACKILSDEGEHVVVEACGPITVMNSLIDPKYIFKTLHRDKETAKAVFDKLGEQSFRFMEQAKAHGAQFISYADVVGGVNIVGPNMAEDIVDFFTYDFVKRIQTLSDDTCMVMLCPKTTFALLGTDKAQLCNVPVSRPMRYGEACIELLGKVKLAGMTCYKNINFTLNNSIFKEVVLI